MRGLLGPCLPDRLLEPTNWPCRPPPLMGSPSQQRSLLRASDIGVTLEFLLRKPS